MAVQVPRGPKLLGEAAPESVGRLDVKLPDATRAQGIQTKAVEGLGEDLVDYYQKVENDSADTEATKRATEYQQAYTEGLSNAKMQEGDPEITYKTLDDKMIEEFTRLTSDDNMSPLVKKLTLARLTDAHNGFELRKLQEYGYQRAKYEDQVTTAAIKIEQKNLTDATTFIDPADPQSLQPFDEAVSKIRSLRLRNGMKIGTVEPDENGNSIHIGDDGKPMKVKINPSADVALKTDLSDGISNAMDTLLKSGKTEAAETLRKKYGDFLLPEKKKQLADDFQKAEVKDEAYKRAEEYKRKGEAAFKGASLEVKDKALQLVDEEQARRERMKDRASTNNYEAFANHIMNRGESYTGINELEEDPMYKNRWNRITNPKQKQAILDMVITPKNSTEEAQKNINDLLYSPDSDLATLSYAQLQERLVGADKKDRNRAVRQWESFKKPETGAQEQARYKRAGSLLQNELERIGHIKKNDYGKFEGKNMKKLLDAQAELTEHLMADPNSKDAKLTLDYVKNLAVSKKTGETFVKPESAKFNGGGKDKPKTMTKAQWGEEYKKRNGKYPKMSELDKFIEDESG